LIAKKENAERELFSKSELLRTVEDHHMIYVRKMQEDHREALLHKKWELHGKDMEFEDIRSYARDIYT